MQHIKFFQRFLCHTFKIAACTRNLSINDFYWKLYKENCSNKKISHWIKKYILLFFLFFTSFKNDTWVDYHTFFTLFPASPLSILYIFKIMELNLELFSYQSFSLLIKMIFVFVFLWKASCKCLCFFYYFLL